jgi:hypothetical protein
MSALVALCLEKCRHQKIKDVIEAFKNHVSKTGESSDREGHGVPDLFRALDDLCS